MTGGYFFSDDLFFLTRVADRPLREVLLQPFGGHLLIARNAIFATTYRLFGADPTPFHWCLLLTHLLNVWLLFRVIRRLTDSAALACLGATMWGTCPVHATVVGWYAVYGQQLAVTALLVVLGQLVPREGEPAPSSGRVLAWCVILLIGATCFGVGIGVALVFPVVALLLRPRLIRRPAAVSALLALPVAVAGLYRWLTRREQVADATGMFEAIALTSSAPIVVMLGHLLGYGTAALMLGFFFVAERWPYLPSTYPSRASAGADIAVGALVAMAFVLGNASRRRQLLAALALALGTYGIIALGRAGFRPEALAVQAGQARYHYAGTVSLAMLLCLSLAELSRRIPLRAVRPEVLLAVWLGVAAIGYARSGWHVETYAPARQWVTTSLAEMDAAIDAAPPGATVYLENEAMPVLTRGPAFDHRGLPGRAALFVVVYPSDVVRGRLVRFVEKDASVVKLYASQGGRLGHLLVAPEAAREAEPPAP